MGQLFPAFSGVHRHVGLLQERSGGIGAANGYIEITPEQIVVSSEQRWQIAILGSTQTH